MINRIAWCIAWFLGWEGAKLPTPQQASAMHRLYCPQFYCHACERSQRMRIEEADEPIRLHCGHTVQYDSDTGVWA